MLCSMVIWKFEHALIFQGAFGRLDPTGEAARTMMDQIPEVECWNHYQLMEVKMRREDLER